jgi:hypothetical protein
MQSAHWIRRGWTIPLLLAGCLAAPLAKAVPSFARQTGMACEACHTVFPELTHFGRMFKANGYTLDNLKEVRDVSATRQEVLALSGLPPISAMVQISDTELSRALPDGTGAGGHSQSGTVDFPQQISIFYAGKIAPGLGAFVQLTYENDAATIGMDNADVRYANNVLLANDRSLVYGVTINNNPTVQDLWNSTPAFGFPYAASNATVSPLAAAQIDGTLGQDVAGLSAYLMWNEALYAELGIYRSAKQGASNPVSGAAGPLDGTTSNVINGTAPYLRVAYEHQWGRHSLEAGVYGATFKLYPGDGAALTGPVNEFRDVAEDFQYQFIGEDQLFSLSGTRIHESMKLAASFAAEASANAEDDLTTLRVNANYFYRRRYGCTLSYFSTTGSTDAGLYPADPAPGVVTSANGSPDTKGMITELNYLPWLNTKLSLQYTHYTRFNGAGDNYDGFGRNASDNDSVYGLLWVVF